MLSKVEGLIERLKLGSYNGSQGVELTNLCPVVCVEDSERDPF